MLTPVVLFNLHNNLRGSYCNYPHFTHEKTETQRGTYLCEFISEFIQLATGSPGDRRLGTLQLPPWLLESLQVEAPQQLNLEGLPEWKRRQREHHGEAGVCLDVVRAEGAGVVRWAMRSGWRPAVSSQGVCRTSLSVPLLCDKHPQGSGSWNGLLVSLVVLGRQGSAGRFLLGVPHTVAVETSWG